MPAGPDRLNHTTDQQTTDGERLELVLAALEAVTDQLRTILRSSARPTLFTERSAIATDVSVEQADCTEVSDSASGFAHESGSEPASLRSAFRRTDGPVSEHLTKLRDEVADMRDSFRSEREANAQAAAAERQAFVRKLRGEVSDLHGTSESELAPQSELNVASSTVAEVPPEVISTQPDEPQIPDTGDELVDEPAFAAQSEENQAELPDNEHATDADVPRFQRTDVA